MKAFAQDFVRTLFANLQTEKNELKIFLLSLLSPNDEVFVKCQAKDWGESIQARATPWAKRLQLLQRVQSLINVYKKAKLSYEAKSDAVPQIIDQFKTYDNLLNFLPPAVFYGQRPSVWWTPRHDIDLIIGTHRYGYANYQQMRQDPELSFQLTDQVGWQYQEYPQADNITRRLKKLVQIFGKPEYQSEIKFE